MCPRPRRPPPPPARRNAPRDTGPPAPPRRPAPSPTPFRPPLTPAHPCRRTGAPEHDRFRPRVLQHPPAPGRAPARADARLDRRPEGLAHRDPRGPRRRPGADPRGHIVLDHRRGRSRGRPVRLLHHGRHHRRRRRPARHDLRRHRRRRPRHRPAPARARAGPPGGRRHPRRRLPGGPGRARGGEADAVHPAPGDDRLRQLPRHPDLHGPGPGDDGCALARVSADHRRAGPHGALPPHHHRRARPAGLDRHPHGHHGGGGPRRPHGGRQGRTPPRCRYPACRTYRSPSKR